MLREEQIKVPEQGSPPLEESEDEEPGQRAMEEYRAWRRRTFGSSRPERILSMGDLMASMREEPPED